MLRLFRPFFLICFFALTYNFSFAQLAVDATYPLPVLINQTMLGFGANITNVTFTGGSQSIGYFNGINSNIGLDSGIVMCTGNVLDAIGPNNTGSQGTDLFLPGDTELDNVSGNTTQDAVSLTLDFEALADTFSFNFVFASEEYPEFANSNYNDAFAFLISGPKPGGGNYQNDNIALLPNSTTPVTINNVNDVVNPQYYVDNTNGLTVQYDGFTIVLEATAAVIPDSTYHLKLVIGDVFDGVYDSGVFLQKNCAYEPDSLSIRLDQPLVINCYDTAITLPVNQVLNCNSIAPDGSDFIILDDQYSVVNGVIDGASSATCDSGYGVSFSVDVSLVAGVLAWGDYYIVPQFGNDGNSLFTACDQNIIVEIDTIPITLLPPDSVFIDQDVPLDISCQDSSVSVVMNTPVSCSSVAADGSDWQLLDSQFNPINGAITGSSSPNCQSGLATFSVDVHFTPGIFNFGTYYLIPQIGTDGNSLSSSCDANLYLGTDTFVINILEPDTLYITSDPTYSLSCQDSNITIALNQLIDCGSVAANGSDFLLVDEQFTPINNGVSGAFSSDCQGSNVADSIQIDFTPGIFNFGTYYVITQTGTDGNSIYTICDESIVITSDTLEINILEPDTLFSTINNQVVNISCLESSIEIPMNQLVDCSSIATDGSDFRLLDGSYNELDNVIIAASSTDCQGAAGTMTITLDIVPSMLNWGDFYIIPQLGTDGNPIYSICDESIIMTPDTIHLNVTDFCYDIQPDLLNVSVLDDDSVGITWIVPSDPTFGYDWEHVFEAYDVYRSLDPLGPYSYLTSSTTFLDTFLVDTATLVDAEAYNYNVRVKFVNGSESVESDSIQSILLIEDPNIPIDTTKLFLTWTEYWGWNNPTYHIMHRFDGGPWEEVTATNVPEYEYNRNLVQDGIYDVKVVTYDNSQTPQLEAESNWITYETIIYDPFVANVMTPDNDGKNDYFLIRNLHQHPNTILKIYNRWGKKIYSSEDYQGDWDGENYKAGTYYYTVEFRGSIPSKQKGHFTIIR